MPSLELPIRTVEIRSVSDLHWHASWSKNQIPPPSAMGIAAAQESLMVTRDGTVIGGFAAYADALLQLMPLRLSCIVCQIDEEDALAWILKNSTSSVGLNKFCRVSLAFDYEPQLREIAKRNQRHGGRKNGSAMLPEDSAIDCREAIARLASVGVRTVTKVRHLIDSAPLEVLTMLRTNAVSIEKAFRWISLDESERGSFAEHLVAQDTRRTIARRLRMQKSKPTRIARADFLHLAQLILRLAENGDSPMMTVGSESLCGIGDILAGLPSAEARTW